MQASWNEPVGVAIPVAPGRRIQSCGERCGRSPGNGSGSGICGLLATRGLGDANITRLLNSLEEKHLIRRLSLTQRERGQLFGASKGGNRLAVILQATGDKKIQQFKARLALHFGEWRTEQSVMTQKAIKSAAGGLGEKITEWFWGRTAQ